jgi:hypothetical protein
MMKSSWLPSPFNSWLAGARRQRGGIRSRGRARRSGALLAQGRIAAFVFGDPAEVNLPSG